MAKNSGSRHPTFDAHDALLDGRVDAALDLHNYSAAEAPSAVRNFLDSWQRRKSGALVHIITGKGRGSPNGPVLRRCVKSLLKSEFRVRVLDFALDENEGGYKVKLR